MFCNKVVYFMHEYMALAIKEINRELLTGAAAAATVP